MVIFNSYVKLPEGIFVNGGIPGNLPRLEPKFAWSQNDVAIPNQKKSMVSIRGVLKNRGVRWG